MGVERVAQRDARVPRDALHDEAGLAHRLLGGRRRGAFANGLEGEAGLAHSFMWRAVDEGRKAPKPRAQPSDLGGSGTKTALSAAARLACAP